MATHHAMSVTLTWRPDHCFYFYGAVAAFTVVFVGFARSYFRRDVDPDVGSRNRDTFRLSPGRFPLSTVSDPNGSDDPLICASRDISCACRSYSKIRATGVSE